jgi:monooxygenase
MSTTQSPPRSTPPADDRLPAHVDVLVIGAGLSGIGAACHLRRNRPRDTFVVLEAREAMGGTWDLFRYPGIRSDSDMYTLGFSFRPWDGDKALADGASIRDYIERTAAEHGVDEAIRYRRRVTRLSWDGTTARWTAEVANSGTGETETVTAGFVYSCTGYYRYDEGYTPEFPGIDDFAGQVLHPQHWPEDLEVTGRRVVVIGSGATAVTLVPSLAPDAAHVTMLQRSPTWVMSLPARDRVAVLLRRLLPDRTAHTLVKWKNVLLATAFFQLSRRRPALVKRLLRRHLERALPEGYDIDTHFTPSYDPWDQRLCLVPDHDLFRAIRRGDASVVTDHVDTFVPEGIRLRSGAVLEADVVVTATGLNLLMLGGMEVEVDGESIDFADTVAYKGMMLSGVPNMAFAVGYTNASWTLKVDLVSEYVCRLLGHMEARGYDVVTPVAPSDDIELRPIIDLSSGYVTRALDRLPRQAAVAPWQLHQNYVRDLRLVSRGELDDAGVTFSSVDRSAALAVGADQR